MSEKILVTGANGFVGSKLTEFLIQKGYEVRGVVRASSDLRFLEGIPFEKAVGNFTDPSFMQEAMKKIDRVVHVGGKSSDWGSYESFYEANVRGTEVVLQAAMNEGVKRYVQISSVAIHGTGNHIGTREEGPFYKSKFPYSVTKKLGEERVMSAFKESGFPVSVIRPGNVYGEKDRTTILPLAEVLLKRGMPYVSRGKYLTCPVYIDNLCDAIFLAMNKKTAVGEAFLVTDGLKVSFREYTESLCDALGAPYPNLSLPRSLALLGGFLAETLWKAFGAKNPPAITRYRATQVSHHYDFSIEKARRILGFEPKVALCDAMACTARWYLKDGFRLKD